MQHERLDQYHLMIQGIGHASIPEPEETLEKIRSMYPAIHIQLLRADLIAGREHILCAAKNAIAGYSSRHRKSKSLAVELLLYVSGQRQISKAITILGVRPDDKEIVLVALGESEDHLANLAIDTSRLVDGRQEDKLVDIDSSQKSAILRKTYRISSKEMEAARLPEEPEADVLKRLVIERSVLLTLEG